MNFVNLVFLLMFSLLMANRVLFTYSKYKELVIKREDDLYFLNNACLKFDHKNLGDHADYCRKIEHKLSMSIPYHTMRAVVDDTLYQELNFGLVAQVTAIMSSIVVVGALYNKYLKSVNYDLPTYDIKKTIKCD